MARSILLILAVLVPLAGTAAPAKKKEPPAKKAPAAPQPNPHLAQGIRLVEDLRETDALPILEKALAWPDNAVDDLIEAHIYLGIAEANLRDMDKARGHFEQVMTLRPRAELPGWQERSPEIRELWAKAGGAAPWIVAPPPPPAPVIQQVVAPPPPVVIEGPNLKRWTSILMLVTGAAAAGVGIGFGASVPNLKRQADMAPSLGEAQKLQTAAESNSTAANVLYGVGGGVAAGGLGLLIWSFFD